MYLKLYFLCTELIFLPREVKLGEVFCLFAWYFVSAFVFMHVALSAYFCMQQSSCLLNWGRWMSSAFNSCDTHFAVEVLFPNSSGSLRHIAFSTLLVSYVGMLFCLFSSLSSFLFLSFFPSLPDLRAIDLDIDSGERETFVYRGKKDPKKRVIINPKLAGGHFLFSDSRNIDWFQKR